LLRLSKTRHHQRKQRLLCNRYFKGEKWHGIGTYAGIFGYDGKAFVIINDKTLGLKSETGELHIRSILEDSKGRLWIGNNGIGVLLKEGDKITNFSQDQHLIHPTSSKRATPERGNRSRPGTLEHVFTIYEDGKGNIWFGDRDAGIWKYDGNSMTNYTQKDGLTDDFAQSIFEDKNGELWFGMGNGHVFKFNGKTFEKQF
ncbi:MAG: two-component regulator propeller domain-containing protein, partial [Bacteroidota bacterium]